MTVEQFFEQYPLAPAVLRVGEDLYLPHARGAANSHAKRINQEVEEFANPSMAGPDDVDDDGPDNLSDDPDEGVEVGDEEGGDTPQPPPMRAQTYGKNKRK